MHIVIALLLASTARAGDGPWTLNPGEHNVYLGADYYRYSVFRDGDGTELNIASPLTASGLTAVWTAGLAQGIEVEAIVPIESVRANDPEAPLCVDASSPADWCETTTNIGDVHANLKVRVLNEFYGAPVSASVLGIVRSGETYADKRRRLTTLGEGQTDVGGGVSLGRADGFGSMWLRSGLDAHYLHRFANDFAGDRKIPADEVGGSVELAFSPHRRLGFGPAATGFWRLDGVDFSPDADFHERDVWAGLAARQVQAGGKLGIFTDTGATISLAVLHSIFARNTPSDTLVISAGVGFFFDGSGQP